MRGFKVLFLLLAFLYSSSVFAQERYQDDVFSTIDVSTVTYSDTLKLDLYTPKKDTVFTRPLLLLVHGGGFASGKRDNPLEKTFSTQMAKKGYVVASMSYRLTRKGKTFGCDCPAIEKLETFKLATEDVLKATMFLRKRAAQLKIDASKIVLIGSSAGAEAVLNTAFMQFHHEFKDLHMPIQQFAGVVSFAGAILDADYINGKNAVPVMMFHGQKDGLVPYHKAPHHFCEPERTGFLLLDGSEAISKRLVALNKAYVLMVDPAGNHDWANLAYAHVDEIAGFIKKVVLEKTFKQSVIRLP